MREGLIPEVSIGTHFFNDLVELDILYLTIFPTKDNNYLNRAFFNGSGNRLNKILPGMSKWEDVLKVIDFRKTNRKSSVYLNANSVKQRCTCFKIKGKGSKL